MAGEWDELFDPAPVELLREDGRRQNGHHPNSRQALSEHFWRPERWKTAKTHRPALRDSHAADKLLRDFSGGE